MTSNPTIIPYWPWKTKNYFGFSLVAVINWKTGEFRWQTRAPDWKKVRRLTEQQWKKEEEEKELKEIPEEETKDS